MESSFWFSAWLLWLRLLPAKVQEKRPWPHSRVDADQRRKPREENGCDSWSSSRGASQHLWWRLHCSGHEPKVLSPRVADRHCASCATPVSATFCRDVWLSPKPGRDHFGTGWERVSVENGRGRMTVPQQKLGGGGRVILFLKVWLISSLREFKWKWHLF